MTMRVWVMAMALLAGVMPLAARAQDDLDDKFRGSVDKAFEAIQSGDPASAIRIVEPVLAGYEKAYAGEKRKIFCAYSTRESIVYMGLAGAAKMEAIAIQPGWCVAQYVRAFALIDLNRYDDAQAAFEKVLEFAPHHARYMNELGFLFAKQKKWQLSVDAYTRAAEAVDLVGEKDDPEHCIAFRGIAYAQIELGQFNDAETALNKCLKIEPNNSKALSELDYIRQQRRKTT